MELNGSVSRESKFVFPKRVSLLSEFLTNGFDCTDLVEISLDSRIDSVDYRPQEADKMPFSDFRRGHMSNIRPCVLQSHQHFGNCMRCIPLIYFMNGFATPLVNWSISPCWEVVSTVHCQHLIRNQTEPS